MSVWLVFLVAVFGPLELLFAVRPREFFHKKLLQDLGYYFINSLVPSLLLAVPMAVAGEFIREFIPLEFQMAMEDLPLWQRILAGLVVGEIGFYWGHRWTHSIPFLWRFHSIHHSAEHVYFLVSAKAHPVDNVFIKLCGLVPAYILGVASPLSPNGSVVPLMIIIVATMWGFFIHSNIRWRLGPLEWLVATPFFHHWHHTLSEPRDKNFASMLPCMDWVFRTRYAPKEWPSDYGIEGELPKSLVGQLVHPFLPKKQEVRVAAAVAAVDPNA